MPRVGPGIAVMEVDHDLEAHRIGLLGQRNAPSLIEVADAQNAGGDGGIHESANADGVDAMTLENLQRASGCAGGIGPGIPHALQLGQPSNIGSTTVAVAVTGTSYKRRMRPRS